MRLFAILGGAMVVVGASLTLYGPPVFALGAWLTSALLIVAGFVGRALVLREECAAST